jgi:hypothetical protein
MKTLVNPSDGGRFSSTEFESTPDNGRGRGPGRRLQSLGDALTAAGIGDTDAPAARAGAASMTVRELLASGESPAGGLLLECQGQADLTLAGNCVSKLAARVAGSGRVVTEEERKEAMAAAACALTVWRTTGTDCDNEPETLGARVAWRAAVRELSRDWLGESIPLCTVSDDWLWFNREQRDESRTERAARLRVERLATTRQLRLLRRLDNLATGKGQRAAVIDKLQAAAMALLSGLRLDEAATLAGFKASGRTGAGARLLEACWRLGLIADGFAVRRHA